MESKMKILFQTLFLLVLYSPAFAFELATTISQDGKTTTLQTNGYAKVHLLKQDTKLKGMVFAQGKLSVQGVTSVIMWSKVEGKHYFSKIPELQNVKNKENLNFSIPFNAAGKLITEIVIEIELQGEGRVSITDLSLSNEK